MKARIKGTKELKDIIAGEVYLEGMNRMPLGINEVEILPDSWNELRNKAAIAAMQAIISNWHNLDSGGFDEYKIGYTAVLCANALIKELESFNGGKPRLRVSQKKKLKVEAKKGE